MVAPAELVAHLRTLPDDWASWLVYADALTERGDPRGQLLVLAQRGEPDAALEDAWMLYWLDDHPDDEPRYERHRRLAPLGGPIFARPTSQLLAVLDPACASLELHDRQVTAAVLDRIARAFDGVPAPDEDHPTLYQAEAADNHDGCDRSRDFLGRWQDFPDEQLFENQWALPHLDEQGIHYYVPAIMSSALRTAAHPWLFESLEYTLQPSKSNLRDYQRGRFARFDRDQRAAIYAYVLHRGHAEAAEAWARVFEAERDGPRADWFEIFHG